MIVGIDFDNTIVGYDALFYRVAREQALVPATIPATKNAVRDHLRATGREESWTILQGEVYGRHMAGAEPFPGVISFLRACQHNGISVRIISHKTRHPFLGAKHDLHAAAYGWLQDRGFFLPGNCGLRPADVFFEPTKAAKIQRIRTCRCDIFIDDLPEILSDSAFPASVGKILFDPARSQATPDGAMRCGTWAEIQTHLALRPPASSDSALSKAIARFPFQLSHPPELLRGGANNRVHLLQDFSGQRWLLKEYFTPAHGQRNRFQTERDFYSYAWDTAGVRCIPRPVVWDQDANLGVFEFVDGEKIPPSQVDASTIHSALVFVAALNKERLRPEAQALALGAEACFTTADHLSVVQRRLDRLGQLQADSGLDVAAQVFVQDDLLPTWHAVRAEADRNLASGGAGSGEEAWAQRCLSASDFGFHNALRRSDGSLVFFDFEYAGWDDPAKLVCDFFCQPAIPAPADLFIPFAAELAATLGLASTDQFVARCTALLPVYRLKWCGIMLNDFLANDHARRRFAVGAAEADARKERQLGNAQHALEAVRATVQL